MAEEGEEENHLAKVTPNVSGHCLHHILQTQTEEYCCTLYPAGGQAMRVC